jgi:hypothetical protein
MGILDKILLAEYIKKFLTDNFPDGFYFEQELLPLNSVDGPVYKLLKLTPAPTYGDVFALVENSEGEDETVNLTYLGIHNITLIEGKIKRFENDFK